MSIDNFTEVSMYREEVTCDIQVILDIDKSISPYLDSIVGSAFSCKDDSAIF